MATSIPLTHFSEYEAAARAIQHSLGKGTPSPAAVRQAVVDLTDLAVRALEEVNQTFEGLALLVIALHPEVKRSPRAKNGRKK